MAERQDPLAAFFDMPSLLNMHDEAMRELFSRLLVSYRMSGVMRQRSSHACSCGGIWAAAGVAAMTTPAAITPRTARWNELDMRLLTKLTFP